MKVEIVGFYPLEHPISSYMGTMHIYLIEEQVDIRGVKVFYKNMKWKFRLPFEEQVDLDTKCIVQYPVFSFSDGKKNALLSLEIRRAAMAFMLKNHSKK